MTYLSGLLRYTDLARTPRRRTFTQFALDEIVLPTGQYEGLKLRLNRVPWLGLWLSLLDEAERTGTWIRRFLTGPSRGGKTLGGMQIPLMYHLFECGDPVVCAVPTLDMVGDKWREDILPMILATQYRDLLPKKGDSSRGGTPTLLQFKNGASLRFMTAGGGDKSRAGFDAKIVVATEVDGFDFISDTSHESDKFAQIEARTRGYGRQRRVYGECTVSIETGRIWSEIQQGTDTRIACKCVHCGGYVTLEREEFVGWEQADSLHEAQKLGRFVCKACGAEWSEVDRVKANLAAITLHRGQTAKPDGTIEGEAPQTDTLGLRFSAVNNPLVMYEDLAADEFRARQKGNPEAAERELLQFVWCKPIAPGEIDAVPLSDDAIRGRQGRLPRGVVALDAKVVTVGIDVGKFLLHFVAVAWTEDGGGTIIDYGVEDVHSDQSTPEIAIPRALLRLRERFTAGYARESGGVVVPNAVGVDARWKPAAVYGFVRAAKGYHAMMGYGTTLHRTGAYVSPRGTGKVVTWVGEAMHESYHQPGRTTIIHFDADIAKAVVHERLAVAAEDPGALRLYAANPNEHTKFVKHLTAEKQVLVDGNPKWEQVRRANHWLDALSMSRVMRERLTASNLDRAARRKRADKMRALAERMSAKG